MAKRSFLRKIFSWKTPAKLLAVVGVGVITFLTTLFTKQGLADFLSSYTASLTEPAIQVISWTTGALTGVATFSRLIDNSWIKLTFWGQKLDNQTASAFTGRIYFLDLAETKLKGIEKIVNIVFNQTTRCQQEFYKYALTIEQLEELSQKLKKLKKELNTMPKLRDEILQLLLNNEAEDKKHLEKKRKLQARLNLFIAQHHKANKQLNKLQSKIIKIITPQINRKQKYLASRTAPLPAPISSYQQSQPQIGAGVVDPVENDTNHEIALHLPDQSLRQPDRPLSLPRVFNTYQFSIAEIPMALLAAGAITAIVVTSTAITEREIKSFLMHYAKEIALPRALALAWSAASFFGIIATTEAGAFWHKLSYWGQIIDKTLWRIFTGERYFLDKVENKLTDVENHISVIFSRASDFYDMFYSGELSDSELKKLNSDLEALKTTLETRPTELSEEIVALLTHNDPRDHHHFKRKKAQQERLNFFIINASTIFESINELQQKILGVLQPEANALDLYTARTQYLPLPPVEQQAQEDNEVVLSGQEPTATPRIPQRRINTYPHPVFQTTTRSNPDQSTPAESADETTALLLKTS
ncbi:MAG: hypothetical protein K0S08_1469 [Gammaproteobacteria bacterium]|jgi:hypothetical protein|nr:hypothetical protein [Gammaproteobacteria bacterium]